MERTSDFRYMPILKWKAGEQYTIRTMDDVDRLNVLPILELIPNGSSPEDVKSALAAAASEALRAHGDRFPFAVDCKWFAPTDRALVRVLGRAMAQMRGRNLWAIPVVTPGMGLAAPLELKKIVDTSSAVLRLPIRAFIQGQVPEIVASAGALLRKTSELHVLLDLEEITGAAPAPMVERCAPYCAAALSASRAASVTIAGGSFPFNLIGMKKGRATLPRVEWQVWRALQRRTNLRRVRFGDYAVTNPQRLPQLDGKGMNPSVAIRYARRDDWLLLKGGLWKGAGKYDYHDLCSLLLDDEGWGGQDYSAGDASIYNYANTPPYARTGGTPAIWRRDATSHHVVATAKRCAGLAEVAS